MKAMKHNIILKLVVCVSLLSVFLAIAFSRLFSGKDVDTQRVMRYALARRQQSIMTRSSMSVSFTGRQVG